MLKALLSTFAVHKPTKKAVVQIDGLRHEYSRLYNAIVAVCPVSRERSIALTELEASAMWAIKSLEFNDQQSEAGV